MSIVLRAALGYLILLFAVRLIGRRIDSMMAPCDLVLLFLQRRIFVAGKVPFLPVLSV